MVPCTLGQAVTGCGFLSGSLRTALRRVFAFYEYNRKSECKYRSVYLTDQIHKTPSFCIRFLNLNFASQTHLSS